MILDFLPEVFSAKMNFFAKFSNCNLPKDLNILDKYFNDKILVISITSSCCESSSFLSVSQNANK